MSERKAALQFCLGVLSRHTDARNNAIIANEFLPESEAIIQCFTPVYIDNPHWQPVGIDAEDTRGPSKILKCYKIVDGPTALKLARKDPVAHRIVMQRLGYNLSRHIMPEPPLHSYLCSILCETMLPPRKKPVKPKRTERDGIICGLMDCVKDHFEIPFFLNRLTDKEAHYQGDWTQCATCADLVWASMHALCLDIPKPDRVNKIHSESKDLRKRARKLPEMFLPAGHDRFEQTKPYPVGFEYPTLTALAERQLSTLFCPAPLK